MAPRRGLSGFSIDTEDIDYFIASLKTNTKKFSKYIDSLGDQAAVIIQGSVLEGIRDGYSNEDMGQFMADRTKIEVHVSGGVISITVSGMSEGEAGNPERPSGGRPKVSTPDVNLWNLHEYGGEGDGSEGTVTVVKDKGSGVTAIRKGSAMQAFGGNVGMVRQIIQGLSRQIEKALKAYVGIQTQDFVAGIVQTASKGKIIIPRGAMAAMRNAGVTQSDLAALGVAKVSIGSGGRVLLFGPSTTGAAGKFVSGRGKIPTKI